MEKAARRTLDYVRRDMTAPEGAFWSAEDADSVIDEANPHEKGEGAFYVWEWQEVVNALGQEKAQWFAFRYGMEREGNVRNDPHAEFGGKNILFQAHTLSETAQRFERTPEQVAEALAEAEAVLLEARAKRTRPHLDDKILTAWNGLMISAFARAGKTLDKPAYVSAAIQAAGFILRRMRRSDGVLLRRYRARRCGN